MDDAVIQKKAKELQNLYSYLIKSGSSENIQEAADTLFSELTDELIWLFVIEQHRSLKLGTFALLEDQSDENSKFQIIDSSNDDVFGQQSINKNLDCTCPNCRRNLAAAKFAPHLKKCMGMGRLSSRVASRRIANNSKDNGSYGGVMSDDERDADWAVGSDRRKKKKDKNGSRKAKSQFHEIDKTMRI